MIKHLTHHEIDRISWDNCIKSAINRLPYALSWWLDCVSPGWEALIMDDYKAVMPLPRKRKFGFDYLSQPFFTQQLGIFSANQDLLSLSDEFLNVIPSNYRFIQIHLNEKNHPVTDNFKVSERSNYLLDLSGNYVNLISGYHRNCRRNVQKGKSMRLTPEPGPNPSIFTLFIKNNLDKSMKEAGNLYDLLPVLMQACADHGHSETLGIYDHTELLSAGWFVHFQNRIFFMVCASTKKGKENQAMYVLLDYLIAHHAGSGKLLDFTGSNMPGVAYFNTGFGAIKTLYPMVSRNRLPWRRFITKR